MVFPVECRFVDENVYLAPNSGVGCRRAAQIIRVLKKESLVGASDTKDLLSESCAFHKKLYSAEVFGQEAQDGFLNDVIPILSNDARDLCEGELTEEELRKAVLSPGIDGLTSIFYKHFWPLLGKNLTRVFSNAFLARRLSVSQRRGIIALLLKRAIEQYLRTGGQSL